MTKRRSKRYELHTGIAETVPVGTFTLHELLAHLRELADPQLYDEDEMIKALESEGRYEGILAYYVYEGDDPTPTRVSWDDVTGYEEKFMGWKVYKDDDREFWPYLFEVYETDEED